MCLISKELPKKVEQDITCYKVVEVRTKWFGLKKEYYSPFRLTPFKRVMDASLCPPDMTASGYMYEQGIHAYLNKDYAKAMIACVFLNMHQFPAGYLRKYKVVKCKIPKGAWYAENFGEIVATTMIW